MSEWKPIRTASKNGTEIDVWVPDRVNGGYRVPDAYWCASRQRWHVNGQANDIAWTADPTHWMPKPLGPVDTV